MFHSNGSILKLDARLMREALIGESVPTKQGRRPKQSRAIATRAALIAAGRECFGRLGFHQTGTPELVQQAQVTRGALYHHFSNKADLFEAVAHDVAEDLRNRTQDRVMEQPGDVLDMLIAGMKIYLDNVAADPESQRILLIDGPAVLSWDRQRKIDDALLIPGMVTSVKLLGNGSCISETRAENIARLLLSALNGAALHIAHAEEPVKASREQGEALEALMSGLRITEEQVE